MAKKIFLIGIIAGLAAALGLAGAFSILSTQQGATAQMMGGNQGMMGMMDGNQGMMMGQGIPGAPWQWNQKSGFSASGISNVDGVQITGISITGNNEVTVNLGYNGTGTAPRVTLVAITNPMVMMGRMHGAMGMPMMMGGGYGGMMMGPGMMSGGFPGMMMMWNGSLPTNSTQWQQMQQLHNQMMGQFTDAFQSQTGSNILNQGWNASNTTVKVRLDGNVSAFDSSGIQVMVFPLTS